MHYALTFKLFKLSLLHLAGDNIYQDGQSYSIMVVIFNILIPVTISLFILL